jgi:hypothetical protein
VDWYKQRVGYYRNAPMIDAGEEAEILHQRAKAYAAEQETGGFIPTGALAYITPKRPKPRAEALVRVGLWLAVDGGYLIVEWDDEQSELETLAARRRSDRERKRAQRERDSSRDSGADKSRDGHVTGDDEKHVKASRQTGASVKTEQNGASYRPVYRQVTEELETGKSTSDSGNKQLSAPDEQNTSRDNFERKRVRVRVREEPKNSSSSADADDGEFPTQPRRRKRRAPERFDDFWKVYPRKVGKIHAEKAYAKALAGGATPDQLIAGASFYAMEKKLTEPQFVKHPATWLNGGCWQDEPDPAYTPPAIGAPSIATRSNAHRPVAEVLAEQADYGNGHSAAPWPDLDFGRMPE